MWGAVFMENINLTPKDIVNKNFKVKLKGFDPADVDEFLDLVIQDYENYAKENQRLQTENDRLVSKVEIGRASCRERV